MKLSSRWKIAIISFVSCNSLADGFGVSKVYHPYVEALEQEIEYRIVGQSEGPETGPSRQTHRLGYGRAFGERWFGEIYLTGVDTGGESLALEGYEIEARRQLTEQGEYWADWGLILELEKEHEEQAWEAAVGILAEKEHGRWSTAVNFLLISEWGDEVEDELETKLSVQTRLRYRSWLEPGFEFHSAQNTRALGPLLQGNFRLGVRKNLHWEAGFYVGLDQDTPDNSFRTALEYEF